MHLCLQRHSVAFSFSYSQFLVPIQWQCQVYFRTGSLDTHFHKHHWVLYTCVMVQRKKYHWKTSSLCTNFFSRDPRGKKKNPACIPGSRRLCSKISLKCLPIGKAEPRMWHRHKLQLLYRSCYSCGGNLNLVVDTLFWRTTKEIVFIRPTPPFLLKAVSGFHVYFQIKLETLLPSPPSADSDRLHNLTNSRHS